MPSCVIAVSLLAQVPARAQALMSSSSLSPAAAAGAAGAAEVDSVVVTAERRTTDLQHSALAISAVKADALDKSFTNDISGLNAIVPGLEITKSSGFENLVTIRGVGSETPENSPSTTPGVSLFVDGVYIANTVALDQTLFDIDHIEVLRGPQGALFGESSIGGAINITTHQPVLNEFSGSGDVAFGDYALSRERAEVNVPIGDTLALRVSAQKYDHSGFTKDVAIPGFTLDDAHDASGKAALLWKPTDNFTATFTGEWYHSTQNGAAQKNFLDPTPGARSVNQDFPSHFGLTSDVYHLNLEYNAPWFTVKSISAYQYLNQVQSEDSSRGSVSYLGFYDDIGAWNTKVESYSEEFDILSKSGTKLDWIAGAFYLHQTTHQYVEEFGAGFPYGGVTTPPSLASVTPNIAYASAPYTNNSLGLDEPSNLTYGNLTKGTRDSYAGFAQATYHVAPWLRLTGGVRYNYDKNLLDSFTFIFYGGVGSNPYITTPVSDSILTYKGQIEADITPENMVYVSASEGYKPAGLNGVFQPVLIPNRFSTEVNTAYQIGSKNTFFNRSLRLNVDAFYYDYKNMQFITSDLAWFNFGISNIPHIQTYGIEAEGSYIGLDDHLRVNGSLAYERGNVKGDFLALDAGAKLTAAGLGLCSPYYDTGVCLPYLLAHQANLKGNTPPAMPTLSGSINATYRFDTQWGSITPRVEVVYRGSEWARIYDNPALDKVPSYTVTNLNLEFIPAHSRFRLDLAATNVFNTNGINSQYTDPFGTHQTSVQLIAPRQVIGSIAYSF